MNKPFSHVELTTSGRSIPPARPFGPPTRLPGWMTALGFQVEDLYPFGADITVSGNRLVATHRDAAGVRLGEEYAWVNAGRRAYAYTDGCAKGLLRSQSPATAPYRLVLTDGPVSLLARAALERDAAPGIATLYAAPGGSWHEGAAAALEAIVASGAVRLVVLAFAPHSVGRRIATRVQDTLERQVPRVPVAIRIPPDGSWVAMLRIRRTSSR